MKRLYPCPFCHSEDLQEYRYDVVGLVSGTECKNIIQPSPEGDTYRIECRCGCKLDKHADELYDRYESIFGGTIVPDDLWDMMYLEWNRGRA